MAMTRRSATGAALVGLSTLLAVVLVLGPVRTSAQQPPQAQPAPAAAEPDMMAMRKNMMAMREKMMAEAKAGDVRLQQLVDQMNAATGDRRIDAMAALLVELTGQHRAAQQRMGQMMMPGMMQMMETMEGMNKGMMRGRGAPR